MEKEQGLSDLLQINTRKIKPGSVIKYKHTNFNASSRASLKTKSPVIRESRLLPPQIVPKSHYIEQRFEPYLRAKSLKKMIFKDITKSTNCLLDRPVSNNKFKVSLLPKVPFTKEMISKFQSVKSFEKLERKESNRFIRPFSQLASNRINENNRSKKIDIIPQQRKSFNKFDGSFMKKKRVLLSKSFENHKKEGKLEGASSCAILLTPSYDIQKQNKSPIAIPQVDFT